MPEEVEASIYHCLTENGTRTVTNMTAERIRISGLQEKDRHAILYIVVVLLFYSVGIIIGIIKYLQREKEEIEEEKTYEDYMTFRDDPDKFARFFRVQRMVSQLKELERKSNRKKVKSTSFHFGEDRLAGHQETSFISLRDETMKCAKSTKSSKVCLAPTRSYQGYFGDSHKVQVVIEKWDVQDGTQTMSERGAMGGRGQHIATSPSGGSLASTDSMQSVTPKKNVIRMTSV